MSRVKELGSFKNHFDYVFITVPSSTFCLVVVKEEDVHLSSLNIEMYLSNFSEGNILEFL